MRKMLSFLAAGLSAEAALAQDRTAQGVDLLDQFWAGEYAEIEARLSTLLSNMFDKIGGADAMRNAVVARCGEAPELRGIYTDPVVHTFLGRATSVTRWSACADVAEDRVENIFIADDGTIATFMINMTPRVSDCHFYQNPQKGECRIEDYMPATSLRLPFSGQWYVFWGGRNIIQNYHAEDDAQRYAVDLVIRRDGRSFEGEGLQLTDYHCWDQPILAPAAGEVVTAVKDQPDLFIGELDTSNPAGNHVILDFGNGEYGLLAHMKQDSITAVAGDRVDVGQEIGRCGNSGNRSEPHLHFHIQDSPTFGAGRGKLAVFHGYIADGTPVREGEPVRGQTVAPAE